MHTEIVADWLIGFEGHPLRKDFPLTVRLSRHISWLYTYLSCDRDRDIPRSGTTRSGSELYTSLYSSLKHLGTCTLCLCSVIYSDFRICRNFDSLSPWEQVGEGATPKRPEELKHVPPPPPPPAEKK